MLVFVYHLFIASVCFLSFSCICSQEKSFKFYLHLTVPNLPFLGLLILYVLFSNCPFFMSLSHVIETITCPIVSENTNQVVVLHYFLFSMFLFVSQGTASKLF